MYEKAKYDLHLHPIESFQMALHDQDSVFGKSSLEFAPQRRDQILQCLMKNIQQRLRQKPARITATLEVSCLASEGIHAISTALQYGIETFVSSYSKTGLVGASSEKLTSKPKLPSTTETTKQKKEDSDKETVREKAKVKKGKGKQDVSEKQCKDVVRKKGEKKIKKFRKRTKENRERCH